MSDEPQMPKNFGDLLQSAQNMQQELGKIQERLAQKQVTGSAGGGMVDVVVNGKQQLVSVKIEKALMSEDSCDMVQDLIVAAVNQGLQKSADLAQEELSQVAGGLPFSIPGLK